MKKHKGFGLIEAIISLSLFSLILVSFLKGVAKHNQVKTANAYAKHIELVINQLQKYQNYMVLDKKTDPVLASVWPTNLEGLMTGSKFWPQCSFLEEQAHHCERPDNVPWTAQKLGYKVLLKFNEQSTAELTIPSPPPEWASPLRRIPFAVVQSNGDIKITIGDPLLSQAFKAFLKKDGTTELTGDWDVGNKNILNVADITLRNADGTVMSVAAGLTRQHFSARHGTVIKSPSCPVRMNAKIKLATQGNIPNSIANDYENYGPMRIAAKPISGGWSIIAEFVATRKSDRVRGILREGVVAGETYCEPQ
ncbi:prepilin-type N-terminal cleavage/methylation domain-containing protein [Photobacterium leiognathi]|uniref:prepilin-type N-terminal cleavage/methylation domain-containing protein n=1 Tax=Photobacterium leiognathi TaxID=553611 RepID=UPI0027387262|nr:prepilin-type N-terminal cleavage/methylation domain-containing protein [Photobacterium leiognathi]